MYDLAVWEKELDEKNGDGLYGERYGFLMLVVWYMDWMASWDAPQFCPTADSEEGRSRELPFTEVVCYAVLLILDGIFDRSFPRARRGSKQNRDEGRLNTDLTGHLPLMFDK